MKWIDRGLSLLLILGGIGHAFGAIGFYHDPETLFWALTASELIFLIAALNLLRTWRPADKALTATAVCGSAAYFIFMLMFGRLIGSVINPSVLFFGVLMLGLTGFGLSDALRQHQ